ncbi:MAG: hypothetical protein NWE78_02995 [Candidatus Bathyarchaeota archaeon]|nr:hypothetical protein [Candidatus Bathyarchaeota archaeon]
MPVTKLYVILALMSFCVILVPVIAFLLGGWQAYWGHALLGVIFAVVAVWARIHYYWDEE